MDKTAREYANNSPSTNEDGHDEGSRNRFIDKGLRKRMFEDEEEDQGTDDDNEDWEGDDKNDILFYCPFWSHVPLWYHFLILQLCSRYRKIQMR